MNKKTILVWFRNDLRICDNEMLSTAYERADVIVPVFVYDPRKYLISEQGLRKTGVTRAQFINESVADLQKNIRSYNGDLHIEVGLPEVVLPELAARYQVDEVYHHREVAFEETHISSLVEEALWKLKLNLRHFIGHTLYHKEDLPFPIKDIPDEFNVFKNKVARESSIRPCIPTPTDLSFVESVDQNKIPGLEELGFDEYELSSLVKNSSIRGGESEAQKRLKLLIGGETKTSGGSGLSPWIALGCLSVHTLYYSITQANFPRNVLNRLLDELWWHDYYRFMFKKHGNRFFDLKGFSDAAPEYAGTAVEFEKWKAGQTENAKVNEAMKTLNATGYINPQLRSEVASYLVNDLDVNWLLGAAYFEEKLIDYSPATNYGSWAHIAGVGSSGKHNIKRAV